MKGRAKGGEREIPGSLLSEQTSSRVRVGNRDILSFQLPQEGPTLLSQPRRQEHRTAGRRSPRVIGRARRADPSSLSDDEANTPDAS